jgi:hypothetical protein
LSVMMPENVGRRDVARGADNRAEGLIGQRHDARR